jgi:hypothetical protein
MKKPGWNWIAPLDCCWDHAGILLADAERGEVTQMPSVPFVSARPDVPQSVMPSQAPPQ